MKIKPRMDVEVIGEYGHDQALLGLGLSFGLTSGMSYNDLMKDYMFGKNEKIIRIIKTAHKLAGKDGGHNKFLESIQLWLDINAPRYWWSEFDTYRVGTSKQSECYDDKTEVLTKDGWKFFKDVIMEDEFATITMDSDEARGGVFEYQKPTKIICDDYNGLMKSFKSSKFDLLVTPNHRMIIYKNGGMTDVLAQDFNEAMFIPKGCDYMGEEVSEFVLPAINCSWNTGFRECRVEHPEMAISMDNWLKFLGLWLSEGSCKKEQRNYNTIITQNEGEISDEIDRVMATLPFNVHKLPINRDGKIHNRWIISNKQLFSYLVCLGDTYSKHIPKEYKNLSNRQIEILYDYMFLGDGTKASGVYSTVSKELADDVQEILLKLGFASNIYTRYKDDFVIYTVNKQVTENYCIQKENITDDFYNGKIYCVTVPNGTLYVRRNGKATWCGNSTMHTLVKQMNSLLSDANALLGITTRFQPTSGYEKVKEYYIEHFEHTSDETHLSDAVFEFARKISKMNKIACPIEQLIFVKGILTENYLQRRIVSLNYKVMRNIIQQRYNHRLPHWKMFIDCILEQVEKPKLLEVKNGKQNG